jgi:hypothetical protein
VGVGGVGVGDPGGPGVGVGGVGGPGVGGVGVGGVVLPASDSTTVKVLPAISNVPDRAAPPFACTSRLIVPVPLALAVEVTLIQETLLAAVQSQPAIVVTETRSEPPPAPNVAAV